MHSINNLQTTSGTASEEKAIGERDTSNLRAAAVSFASLACFGASLGIVGVIKADVTILNWGSAISCSASLIALVSACLSDGE